MKFVENRVLSFFCALSILVSLMVPVASAEGIGVDENLDTDSVSAWQSAVGNDVTDFVDEFASFLGVPLTKSAVFWRMMDGTLGSHLGEMDRDTLELVCTRLNNAFGSIPIDKQFTGLPDTMRTWFGMTLNDLMGFGTMHFEVQYPSGTAGYYRIVESVSGIPVVNSRGMYPCTLHESVSSEDGAPTGCQFVPISYLKDKVNMMPSESLYNLGQDYGLTPMKYDKYWILKKAGSGATDFVLADANGYPCVARYEEDKWASNQERPTTNVTENGNVVEGDYTDNSTNIDMEGMTITLPDGSINFIDKIIYDESTKSYHIDSHDTYNYTTNNYYTWNYYINYTSITYIGQTEEYNKYYEVYYELPDGRDSADLTKEDLEQLNLSIDVIPYGRSADDTSLRSLYHFDGDTKDSSYWNYCTDFTWNKGASLTYMDAGVFDGALYLDETEHDFTVTLPSGIGFGDYTIQFRYYQSATPAPQNDSYIQFGNNVLLRFNGSSLLNADGSAVAVVPVGSWNEIAIMRSDGTVYIYLNGLCVYQSDAFSSVLFNDSIVFHFGSQQQTFKYFDELRVLDFGLVSGGLNYECTSVPYDSNLTLVLPDSALPVADEYWSFDNPDSVCFTDFREISSFTGYQYYSQLMGSFNVETGLWGYNTDYCSVVASGRSGAFVQGISNLGNGAYDEHLPFCGLVTTVYSGYHGIDSLELSGSYFVSILLSDGSVYRTSLKMPDGNGSYTSYAFDSFRISLGRSTYYSKEIVWFGIHPNKGETLEIIAVDFSTADTFLAEWVESVTPIDKADLNTPTLAVRTDIDITSYQIGGVRPSIPEKGQVWAMVENDRIVSIQIYNGQAWEGVDGRIWTGQRWIPASSYNIITLQDMYDIVDATPNYEYIYSEAGFWAWWQKSWNAFTEKLFQALGSGGSGSGCQHAYAITSETESTCSDPGKRTYTCALCENQYVETLPALGHDWIQTEETPTEYSLPEGTACPDCAGLDYAAELDEDSATYSCTCNSCETVWTVQAVVTEGETIYNCSRCGATATESDLDNSGFFDSVGNFLADGVTWVTDKLKKLVDSLDGLNKIFSEYVSKIREKAGEYPAFLSAALSLMPEDLMTVFWFGVVAFVLLAVWLKWLR